MLLETGLRGRGGLKRNSSKMYFFRQRHFHGLSCAGWYIMPGWEIVTGSLILVAGWWVGGRREAPLKVNRDNRKPGRKEGRREQLCSPQISLFFIITAVTFVNIIIFLGANECLDCCWNFHYNGNSIFHINLPLDPNQLDPMRQLSTLMCIVYESSAKY